MSVTKRISGDYTLQSIGVGDKIIMNTHTVTINGNLTVLGNTSSIISNNTFITDNVITLNANLSATSAPTLNAGIEVNRGSSANVFILWNETYDKWQITNDGAVYGNIATSSSTIANLYADTDPTLSANLNLNSKKLFDTTSSVAFYAGAPNSGKSGIYVDNTNGTQELATKNAAIAFSIIFG